MKFGTLYSYWGHEWKCDYIETAKRMKKCGCEVLEVGAPHLLDMTDEQLKELKAKLDEARGNLEAAQRQYDYNKENI